MLERRAKWECDQTSDGARRVVVAGFIAGYDATPKLTAHLPEVPDEHRVADLAPCSESRQI